MGGQTIIPPQNYSEIFYVVITFDSENKKKKDYNKNLIYNIDRFISKINKIIKIYTNNFMPLITFEQKGSSIYKIYYENELIEEKEKGLKSEVELGVAEENETVNYKKFKKIINLMNKDIEIDFYYTYYLNAVRYYEKNEYRYCILDCATSIESLIHNVIDNEYKNIGLNSKLRRKILDETNGLIEEIRLLIPLKIYKKFNYENIYKPRNKAIHSDKESTKEEAYNCLIETRKILIYYDNIFDIK